MRQRRKRTELPRGGSLATASRRPDAPRARSRRHGIQGRPPVKRKRKPVPHIEVGAGIVWRRGRILLCKRRQDAMLGGLWEFPGGKRRPGENLQQCIRRELREECGLPVTVGEHLVDVTHTYSHLKVTLRCYHCRAASGRVRLLGCDGARWVRPAEVADYPLPPADVRILEALSSTTPGRAPCRRPPRTAAPDSAAGKTARRPKRKPIPTLR